MSKYLSERMSDITMYALMVVIFLARVAMWVVIAYFVIWAYGVAVKEYTEINISIKQCHANPQD